MKDLFIYIKIETRLNGTFSIDVDDILRWGKDNNGYFIICNESPYNNAGIFYITRVSFLRVIKYKSKGNKKHESN